MRVRAWYGALSRGTEGLVLAGHVPASEFTRMRAPFMGGNFPFPVKYGYSTVGSVEAGPADLEGRIVFALHPHQDLFNVPSSASSACRTVCHPAALCLRRIWKRLSTRFGTARQGQPTVSLLLVPARLARWWHSFVGGIAGAEVTLVEINPARAEVARKLGVDFATPKRAPADCDLVFHASATASGLATALESCGEEATVVDLSWYGEGQIEVPLGAAFHSRRLRLVSSQVGQVAPSRRPRWTRNRRLAAALSLLADDRLDALIAPAVTFQDLPARLPDILNAKSNILCQLIRYA